VTPPLTIELSRDVRAACRARPVVFAGVNRVLLRAARRLVALLEAGETRLIVAGRAEDLSITVMLAPPDVCRVEAIDDGIAPDAVLVV
jgi:hypothetical protein